MCVSHLSHIVMTIIKRKNIKIYIDYIFNAPFNSKSKKYNY